MKAPARRTPAILAAHRPGAPRPASQMGVPRAV